MAELNDKLITYGNLSTFHDNLINDSVTSGNSTWSSEKIASEIQQGGGGGSATIENVTYAQLKAKRDNSQLVKGQQYRITDYVTMANSDSTPVSSAEHPFDLIVTAIDVNKLSETGVKVAHCANDDYFVSQPFRYYIDEGDADMRSYKGTIEIDGTTYHKWYYEDSGGGEERMYILTTQETYTNTPDGEDENGEYYYTTYQFAGFLNSENEEVDIYDRWEEKHKCIIKTEEVDGTKYLLVGDIFLQSTETYQTTYEPKLNAWEAKYCLDNDKSRFDWAQVEQEGLGFSALKVSDEKIIANKVLVLGDEYNCLGNDYEGSGHYYIDEGAYVFTEDGTIEDNGTTYYKWYESNKDNHVLTTQSTYTNSVSGTDSDGCEYYDTVYNIVGEITIDDESFENFYKSYKRIIKTDTESETLDGTFLYKRYASGDTQDSYAWILVNNSNNKEINDKSVDWDNVDTNDIIYTSTLTPSEGTIITGSTEVVEYNSNVQYIPEGKGVIYYLKDEFNNEAEYDFKNVIFNLGDNIIQTYWDGETYLYKRYSEADIESGFAYAYLNNSDYLSIDEYYNKYGGFGDINDTNLIYFENERPSDGEYNNNGNCYVMNSKYYENGSKFTFGNVSEINNPVDDTFNGNSNNNNIESKIIDEVRYIPVLDLPEETVDYGKGGTNYEAGSNIQIVNGVISATDTKYNAGTNISINGNNTISCTYQYSLPTASNSTLGGVKVGNGLGMENGVLSLSGGDNISVSDGVVDCNYTNVDKGIINNNGTLELDGVIYELLAKLVQDEYNSRQPNGKYLTFEATDDDTVITFRNYTSYGSAKLVEIECSKDLLTWKKISPASNQTVEMDTLNSGETLYVRGNNAAYSWEPRYNSSPSTFNIFGNNKLCYVYGNIMSLINKKGFDNLTGYTEDYVFPMLFSGATIEMNSSKHILMPSSNTTRYCYYNMFKGCTSLTTAPELPATAMSEQCYARMFSNCTSLATAPELPAYTLANHCYEYMFSGCNSLTTLPSNLLPATTLAPYCYAYMFQGCTGLTTLPNNLLPATTLTQCPYINMFDSCIGLTTVPSDLLPATNLRNGQGGGGQGIYERMFANCKSLTNVPILPATTLSEKCYTKMFEGCISLTTLPNGMLPSTNLSVACYQYMFEGCTGLTTVPSDLLPATTLAQSCYISMFRSCTSLTTAPALPAIITKTANNNYFAYGYMFDGCTSLTTAPELNSVSLYKRSYDSMFNNCSSLAYIKCLATDISESDCTKNWLNGVAANGTFEKDASMSSWTTGTSGIPSGWTVQDYVALSAE